MTTLREEDVAFETDLARDGYSVKTWVAYLKHKADAPARERFVLYERALQLVPGSYKLWHAYVLERRTHARKRSVKSGRHELMNNLYERCIVFMHKMPRIWTEYCEYLVKCGRVTLARRTFDRALRSLPITQHGRIWKLYADWAKSIAVTETAVRVWGRYMKLQPDMREDFVEMLLARGLKGKAAAQLAVIVNDVNFVSKKGKSKHTLWMELCTLVSKFPDAARVASLNVENLVRAGLLRFTDETGTLWCALSEYFIRLARFERARDVYEEAMESVSTVRDFSLVFDAYAKFEEEMLNAKLQLLDGDADDEEEDEDEDEDDVDLRMARLEQLMERRPFLLSSVLLRQNPHNVKEWKKRIALFTSVEERLDEYTRACKTVDPVKAVQGKVSELWLGFAKVYEKGGNVAKAEFVFEKASAVRYRTVPELAGVWCAWAELHLRAKGYARARELLGEAVEAPSTEEVDAWQAGQKRKQAAGEKRAPHPPAQMRLHKNNQLWALYVDIEESLGGLDCARAAYDRMMELKVATAQNVLNYATLLVENKFWEDAYKVYERALVLFGWPHSREIWLQYLKSFVGRYGNAKLERARDLFEQCLAAAPDMEKRQFFLLYIELEVKHGLRKRAIAIMERATKALPEAERFDLFLLYIRNVEAWFGTVKTRAIYEAAINDLPDAQIKDMCLRFAEMERRLGEIDRARAIFQHGSQFCEPTQEPAYWDAWRGFEVNHGNEDTFRDMLRVKRAVQAQYVFVFSSFACSKFDCFVVFPSSLLLAHRIPSLLPPSLSFLLSLLGTRPLISAQRRWRPRRKLRATPRHEHGRRRRKQELGRRGWQASSKARRW